MCSFIFVKISAPKALLGNNMDLFTSLSVSLIWFPLRLLSPSSFTCLAGLDWTSGKNVFAIRPSFRRNLFLLIFLVKKHFNPFGKGNREHLCVGSFNCCHFVFAQRFFWLRFWCFCSSYVDVHVYCMEKLFTLFCVGFFQLSEVNTWMCVPVWLTVFISLSFIYWLSLPLSLSILLSSF